MLKTEAYVPGAMFEIPEPPEIILPDKKRVRKAVALLRRWDKGEPCTADMDHFKKLKALFKASLCQWSTHCVSELESLIKELRRWE